MSNEVSKNLKPIYVKVDGRPMNLAVFGSGAGTNLEALLQAQNSSFQITTIFSDRKCRFLEVGQEQGLSSHHLSFQKFVKEYPGTNQEAREAYDTAILDLLKDESIDCILLAGYMRLIQKPLLEKFPHRILNVHPADLTIRDATGNRQFIGAHGLELALQAGETTTRSTVILVDPGVDTGSILVLGPSIPFTEGFPLTPEKIEQHQMRQKQESDWPACKEAITMIAEGRVSLDTQNRIYIDSQLSPKGYAMEKSVTR